MNQFKKSRYSPKYVPIHGTKNGYDWHRRGAMEEPCVECRDAMIDYWKQLRRERPRSGGRTAKAYGVKTELYSYLEVISLYGSDCHICLKPINLEAPRQVGRAGWENGLHIDHVIPMSKGGEDTLANIRPSHGKCNIIKHTTIL
jgi:5-methylcytosine-specific restriction endonuclease McrA